MDEPIAIIGLDARFPGDGETAEKFYESLLAKRSARSEVPADRYNANSFWHPDGERSGSTRTKCGHYLKGSVSAFDAPFFSITPSEARSMDPQQRGMLESVYRALENAGVPISKAAGSQTGVYVGCFTSDYNDITSKDLDMPSKYAATGTVASMLSNRVSWFYDFRGPSMTIDTACSSSLVAAHEACINLKLREISMAVVGGCNLILSPEMSLKLGAAGVLGPDGKSYSFDHRGNGYARGEGFGVVVLKRVSDAIHDGDLIRAIIRNTSTNSDGRSPGITQPTKDAQAKLIKHVYSRAGLDPALTRFFEAHGTGTPVGDPIEASAIGEVFAPFRSKEQPLYVGALKSNVGHLEGAAGVAAIIKGVLTLESGVIPPNIWFEKPNANIQDSWHLKFPTEPTVWPQSGLRRMSINSFGIGGSNAHVVMDDAYYFLQTYRLVANHRTISTPKTKSLPTPPSTPPQIHETNLISHRPTDSGISLDPGEFRNLESSRLVVLSSHDEGGVARAQESHREYLVKETDKLALKTQQYQRLEDLSYTLITKRTHHAWRSFGVVNLHEGLQTAFKHISPPVRTKAQPRLAFIFTGQGAQWPAMGMGLMSYPAFQHSLLAADHYLSSLGSAWSLMFELSKTGDASRIDDPEFCQPICTALQIALVDLLASWNIHAHAIAGHSSGEVAAAYAVGAISRRAALKVAYYRGKLSAKLCNAESQSKTTMAAVGLGLEETRASIDRINDMGGDGTLEVACMNSWNSHTVSGDAAKIDALVSLLSSEKVFARKLNVKIAYHSQYMREMADEYLRLMGELEQGTLMAPSRPQFCSSVCGTVVSDTSLQDANYWVQNLVSPVRFRESVDQMLSLTEGTSTDNPQGSLQTSPPIITDVLEIGPHSALKGPFLNIAKQAERNSVEYHSILKRMCLGADSALEVAGSLFCRGYDIDLQYVNDSERRSGYEPLMLIDLPGYSFNHSKEYWNESSRSKNFRLRSVGRHELLGAPVLDWNENCAVWRNYIRVSENPWVQDHKVTGDVLYPAAGMLVMALEAGRQMTDPSKPLKGFRFRDVSFHSALRIPDDAQGIESQFCLRPCPEENVSTGTLCHQFELYTNEDGKWNQHCQGQVHIVYEPEAADQKTLDDELAQESCTTALEVARATCLNKVSVEKLYSSFLDSGLEFGSSFQTLSDVYVGDDTNILATVTSSVDWIKEKMPYQYVQPHLIHPSTLDGIVHANLAAATVASGGTEHTRVPIYAQNIWISAGPQTTHKSYTVASKTRRSKKDELESTVNAAESETGKLLVCASGLRFKAISRNVSKVSPDSSMHNAYNIDWKPNPTLLNRSQASEIFGLPMKAEEDPSVWMGECEELCLQYIRRYVNSPSGNISDTLDWHHKKYVSWMKHVLSDFEEVTELDIPTLEEKVTARGTPEGRLIIAVGQALNEMLGGPRDPLDVIFKDKIAENVYRDGLGSKRCYVQLCNYIDALAHKNPRMNILEIGAGTGGATRPVMETLTGHAKRYQHYDFTDISPSFFEQARETFSANLDSMSFKILNVEKSPSEQGFLEGHYDLIVAANVLHATKSIDASLTNVRKLLKPGGKLLLFEITSPAVLLGTFCFGVLPGWWLSEDVDRIWGPLMSAESWAGHLSFTGFTGLDAVFQDFSGSKHQMSSILVSTAAGTDMAEPKAGKTYIVVDETSELHRQIGQGLLAALPQHASCDMKTLKEMQGIDVAGSSCIVLAELETSILRDIQGDIFESVKHLILQSRLLLWVMRGGTGTVPSPDLELVTGLSRVARAERDDTKFITLSFDGQEAPDRVVSICLQTLRSADNEAENAYRVAGGITYVSRLVKSANLTEHIRAQSGELGAIEVALGASSNRRLSLRAPEQGSSNFVFEDDTTCNTVLSEHEVEFQVLASGIDSKDLASLQGKLEEPILGLEASGIVTRVGSCAKFQVGDRVLGFSTSGAIKTHVRTVDGLLAKTPSSMSMNEAACLSMPYTTAYGVLYETGNIRAGDTILVHYANSPVGQSFVTIAQHAGATVFATVDGSQKRDFLQQHYSIPKDYIFSAESSSLKHDIYRLNSGRGVDIVVNCVTGEKLADLLDCVAPFGRVVALGFTDSHHPLRDIQGALQQNKRIESFDLAHRLLHDTEQTAGIFQRMAEHLFTDVNMPLLRKIPVASYPISRIPEACRALQTSDLVAAIVLTPQTEDVIHIVPSRQPTASFDTDATYVIAGGLGGLGRSVARWMASRGAKNLILLSRRGPIQQEATNLVQDLEAVCDKVATPSCDVRDFEALKSVIQDCLSTMPPIKGCIQGSMVLKDNRLEDMNANQWNDAVRSRVDTSWNLHKLLSNGLDFFIFLNSAVGVTGNAEQANYAAGNTFQDALARHIRSNGVYAVSIDLPVIQGVGFVAEKPELMDYMRSTGWSYINEQEFHSTLDFYCHPMPAPGPLLESQVIPRLWLPQDTAVEGCKLPTWRHDPLFSHLSQTRAAPSEQPTTQQQLNHATLLAASTSRKEADKIVLEALLLKLSRVLSVEVSNIDPAKPLHSYGVDSLVAVDLRSWLSKELHSEVSVFDITNKSSIYQLASTAVEKSTLSPKADS